MMLVPYLVEGCWYAGGEMKVVTQIFKVLRTSTQEAPTIFPVVTMMVELAINR
jgi:hypothetical protein